MQNSGLSSAYTTVSTWLKCIVAEFYGLCFIDETTNIDVLWVPAWCKRQLLAT